MKLFLTLVIMFLGQLAWCQQSFTDADARQVVDTFFEGFHEGDTLKMRSVLRKEVPTQTAFTTPEGEDRIVTNDIKNLLSAIANRGDEQQWEEKLLDYKVSVDGNLAHVWTPYEFYLNGTFSHCGANAFTLAKTVDGWKIIHLIDSRRRKDCRM